MILLLILCYWVPGIQDLYFLTGTWKVDGKMQYETWERSAGGLTGKGYNQQKVTELLDIKTSGGHIIYTATVPGQNGGQPVDFILNEAVKDKYSFENLQHDFPRKIQYTKQDDSTLVVAVLGDQGKGFSYKMRKQAATRF